MDNVFSDIILVTSASNTCLSLPHEYIFLFQKVKKIYPIREKAEIIIIVADGFTTNKRANNISITKIKVYYQ